MIVSTRHMGFVTLALDRASVRTVDRDGRLHVALSNISKASVDPYLGEEIPDGARLGLDPKKVYYLLRSPEELAAGTATFNNLPILSQHIPVNSRAPQKELTVGSTGTDAAYNSPYLQNSAVIWDQDAIDEIDAETKKEWSCGYYYVADMTPGTFGGLRYDGIMRNIVGNHVALVDEGRAGRDVVVGDQMPRGLYMSGFKTRTALMLNAGLAVALAPKLALDAKLDLSKTLAGVTAGNLGKNADKLAAAIVKKASPVLAQDAELDADDVCKVIAAINGASSGMTEDEDELPADADKDAPALDAGDDILAKVMAFVEGKLSDEDMAALGQIASGGATDEEPDDIAKDEEPGDDDDNDKDKPAMDRAAVARTVAATILELRTAEREVFPLIGEVKIACDNGAAVYKLALDHAGVSLKGVHPSAFRALVGMLGKSPAANPAIAQDRATVSNDFASRFPGAGRIIPS